MIVLGLTGSIGTGKTTTARLFEEAGVPTIGADAIVHALYAGAAAEPVGNAFPGTVKDGVVDRTRLSAMVVDDPAAMRRLEAIVHPLVEKAEKEFIERHRVAGVPVVLVDIPLLFEAGRAADFDRIVVTSCAPALQRARVLARPGMGEAKFEAILGKQIPDAEKRARADFVVQTDHGLEAARARVQEILKAL
ncbi:dephospho-CoA kinase [Pararhizobium mangrovi]|uniref:Dephospho-CoA kinase n=1 Tax=Pararhizobium mangrovi TaxID=2590452 RepID=A0A506TYV7_9HYPH|nr:dephospho-CoA kinase [Pararhizobium mangrovi]TPW27262.1 dephospho-CoA kinase [Pararhizobium mangrovi]